MNIKKELEAAVGKRNSIYLNNIEIDPLMIKAIMINEVVPSDVLQDFYGVPDADYLKTTIPLFQGAGAEVKSIQDILQMGIYITNAVKTPKTKYAIEKSSIEDSLPYLETELSLFPNVKVIMLMGDVAKKAFNVITKKATKKNVVPAVSTYKLRTTEIYYNGIRVMPSYIMTGGNILIEKSKVTMATEDIATMLEIIK
ncbi:uracil-DNA glycosylase family protein [Anaeromassilibacillus senegalensis]|uniref:Uracil-DNA glycosylase family protein n=1 Tax=Anaeromassilibacillus senegalensis TaxID=1673717 RepID=A0ABS9MLW7_9FIRM|nr:uracil-DNA glycosylase family protein [Anaeromassilibacillus senegalensis]MCG4611795.1 uracil-DNA glycosylase family protein [Anaeromassilibacillus senegalensis]